MKIHRRIVTLALVLAVVACALVLTLRSFAQPPSNDITLSNWQKLKAPYDEDGDLWEKEILKKHAKKYCVTHKKKDGTQKQHCPKSDGSTAKSLIVPVGSSTAPAPMQMKPAGVNVTQQITGSSSSDTQAILDTFDNN